MEIELNSQNRETYSLACSSPVAEYLIDLERETYLKINKPQMMTGWIQGRMLSLFSRLIKPKTILEIGTFTGYGTLCLAEGLDIEGKILTVEVSEENAWLARKYFSISPFFNKIELKMGLGLEIIPNLTENWDLVYIDADKINNKGYFDLIWPKVRAGGLVLIDNTLARGGVFKSEIDKKPFEKAVAELNAYLSDLSDGFVLMLPVRDGLTAIAKK